MLTQGTIAKLVTMNTELLKEMSLEDVLIFHPLLNAQGFSYGTARKTKPIKARPINSILDKEDGDQSVFEKMLLSTLEGSQPLKRGSFICWGVDNDVWQQAKDKLHKKYTPTEVDEQGWVTFVPKEGPDAEMNCHQVTVADGSLGPVGGFCVINPTWGDERLVPADMLAAAGIDPEACGLKGGDQVKVYLHYGVEGDFVLQNKTDSTDTYRIAKKFFNSTYVALRQHA